MYEGLDVPPHESDTPYFFDLVSRSVFGSCDGFEEWSEVRGPFSFLLFKQDEGKVIFGRDPLGRRSLVHGKYGDEGDFFISSCLVEGLEGERVGVDGIFEMELGTLQLSLLHSWSSTTLSSSSPILVQDNQVMREFERLLRASVGRRIIHPLPLSILFSGGVDCSALALYCHLEMEEGVPIHLLNVCFDGGKSPDRYSALCSHFHLSSLFPSRPFLLTLMDVDQDEVEERKGEIIDLIAPCSSNMDFNIGTALWFASRG